MATFCSLHAELESVEQLMRKEIIFSSTSMEDLIDLPMNTLDKYLCPSIVLSISKLTEQGNQRKISLAAIFQYVFLSRHIHSLVSDGDMPEHARQYPILIGDFMFGQSFLKICTADLFSYAIDFVKTIEIMNEGVIMRWQLKNREISLEDYKNILGKEKASLTALASRLSAKISGIKEMYLGKLEDFGYSLGMAWAVWEEQLEPSLGQEYLAKANGIIVELDQNLPVRPLRDLYESFSQVLYSEKTTTKIKE